MVATILAYACARPDPSPSITVNKFPQVLFTACLTGTAILASSPARVVAAPLGGFHYAATPPTLSFHGAVGIPTASQNVTITAAAGNTGPVIFTGCSFGGGQAADFALSPSPGFPLNVAAGASVNVPIRFTAGSLGPRNTGFSCQSSNGIAVGGGFPISLNGSGVLNTLTTPSTLVFPDTVPGSTSTPLNVTATAGAGNTGNVTITACALTGTHAGDFAQTPPATNVAIAPGASILIPVIFSPAATGVRAATLTCNTSNGQAASFGVALSGAGAAPATHFTTRVSLASDGGEGNQDSWTGAASANGRHVVFSSSAGNLVPGDTNSVGDVFVRDRQTNLTQRVSVASGGSPASVVSVGGAISADGRHVVFETLDNGMVPGDTNMEVDVFVHDRQTAQTQRVSVANGGGQTNGWSYSSSRSLSADGRHVAFSSSATNLVPGDTNGAEDVFVHDRQSGQTRRVSVATGGGEGNYFSDSLALSADGRHVVFRSLADTLVPNDTNAWFDVFLHDRQTGQTERVSVASNGVQGQSSSEAPAVSADGRFVAFSSWANNLVAGDTNARRDVFVRDRMTGQTQRVSLGTGGTQANGSSDYPDLSADGRLVSFVSEASNLVPDDTNGADDAFVHDRQTGQTRRVSVATGGGQGNTISGFAAMSADGRQVVFQSLADNLVPGDTNAAWDVFVHELDLLFGNGFD